MNGYNKKVNYLRRLFSFFALLFLTISCSTIMEPEGDAVANPMIEQIEKYRDNNGHYPVSLMKLVPEYLPHYDFQAYFYKYNSARGKELDKFIEQGLIPYGKGEGYILTVKFQQYSAQCTYVNGVRKSCRYIGHI